MPPPNRLTSEMPSSSISTEPTFNPLTLGLPPPSTPAVRSNRLVTNRPFNGSWWMRSESFTLLTCMPSVAMTGAAPVTSTVEPTVPTSIAGSMVTVWPTSTLSFPSHLLNPGASAVNT